jgi:hypothetical protein
MRALRPYKLFAYSQAREFQPFEFYNNSLKCYYELQFSLFYFIAEVIIFCSHSKGFKVK